MHAQTIIGQSIWQFANSYASTQLLAFDACRKSPTLPSLPQAAAEITSPLVLSVREAGLAFHPDGQFIAQGIAEGFRIGFSRQAVKNFAHKHNLLSAGDNPQVIDQYTENELKQNRMAIVLDPDLQLLMQFSPFGWSSKSTNWANGGWL